MREEKHPRAVGPSSRPVGQESTVTHPEPAGAGPGPPPVPLLPWTGQEWSLSKGNVTVTSVHLVPADPSRSFPGVYSTRLQSHGSVTPAVHPRLHPRGVDTSVEANSAFWPSLPRALRSPDGPHDQAHEPAVSTEGSEGLWPQAKLDMALGSTQHRTSAWSLWARHGVKVTQDGQTRVSWKLTVTPGLSCTSATLPVLGLSVLWVSADETCWAVGVQWACLG